MKSSFTYALATLTLAAFGVFAPKSALAHNDDAAFELDYEILLDARLATSSSQLGWLDAGLGKTRYGAGNSGNRPTRFTLGEASLVLKPKFGWDFSGYVHAQYIPEQTNQLDVVEAFLSYHPVPISGWRIRARAGMFFPPISLEHTDVAWTSPYSITPSAINSWVGEEIKSTGAEISLTRRFEDHRLSLTAGAYGWNDPAGTLLVWRGWALHDVKATAFGRFPLAPVKPLVEGGIFYGKQARWVEPHHEIDDRVGYYWGANWDWAGGVLLKALYYNNMGNPRGFNQTQYSWQTKFVSLGAVVDLGEGAELLAQFMDGRTEMGPRLFDGTHVADVDYQSYYVLVSKEMDAHRVSARFDHFSTTDNNSRLDLDNNNETGSSFMGAYSYRVRDGHQVFFELLWVKSDRANRADIGLATRAKELQMQISYRLTF